MSEEHNGEAANSANEPAESPPSFRWSLRAGEPLPPEAVEPLNDSGTEAMESSEWEGPPTEAFVWDPAAVEPAETEDDAGAAGASGGGDQTDFMTQPMTQQDIQDTLAPLAPAEVHIATPYEGEPAVRFPPPSEDVPSSIDSLFGDGAFREYEDGILPLAPRPAPPASAVVSPPPRVPFTSVQKVLLWIAGSLVAALALVALFVLGIRIADRSPQTQTGGSTQPVDPPPAGAPALGPGMHPWNALAGGECIEPFESAWKQDFTVVDCGSDHSAQLVARGALEEPAGAVFPGVEALQSQVGLLCATPKVIDYSALGTIDDVRVSVGFPPTEADWAAGDRAYYCFVSRASGKALPGSVALGH